MADLAYILYLVSSRNEYIYMIVILTYASRFETAFSGRLKTYLNGLLLEGAGVIKTCNVKNHVTDCGWWRQRLLVDICGHTCIHHSPSCAPFRSYTTTCIRCMKFSLVLKSGVGVLSIKLLSVWLLPKEFAGFALAMGGLSYQVSLCNTNTLTMKGKKPRIIKT